MPEDEKSVAAPGTNGGNPTLGKESLFSLGRVIGLDGISELGSWPGCELKSSKEERGSRKTTRLT